MNDLAIKVSGIGKAYRIGLEEEKHDTIGAVIASWLKSPLSNFKRLRQLSKIQPGSNDSDIFWALKEVSFEVKSGEVIGIIGRNGAGKSTLLKILSRVTDPTTGEIDMYGRVASLLEVGTGFNPELTGRENVFLNGTILGMTKKEVENKFDEIIEFSSVKKFIDTPIKRYSSGMKVRLAFAVAAHLDPEILIIDEVLAVGDAEFQKKCLGKMQDVARQGRTVLFVSHDMAAVENICERVILLQHGKIVDQGETQVVISNYLLSSNNVNEKNLLSEDIRRKGKGEVKISNITIRNLKNEEIDLIASGMGMKIVVKYQSNYPNVQDGLIGLGIHDHLGGALFKCRNDVIGLKWEVLPNSGSIECVIPKLPLVPGKYSISAGITIQGVLEDVIFDAHHFQVVSGDYYKTGKIPRVHEGKFLADYAFTPSE